MTNHVQYTSQISQRTDKPDDKVAPANDQQRPAPVESPDQPAPAKQ